jgi:hypothetical protein
MAVDAKMMDGMNSAGGFELSGMGALMIDLRGGVAGYQNPHQRVQTPGVAVDSMIGVVWVGNLHEGCQS